MDGGGLLKLLVPQIPSLANTAFLHSIGRTPTSSKWDLRTALTVHTIRKFTSDPGKQKIAIGKAQGATLRDVPVKGEVWIAKAVLVAPKPEEETLRDTVFTAIDDLKPTDAGDLVYTRPPLEDVEVEWTGFRADKNVQTASLSEEEKYKRLLAEPTRKSETTILYFHGGAYYLCDPMTHRDLVARLAKHSQGRVCSVRYRLAPKTAFPGQLLDAFMAYMSLIYPPEGALNEPTPAKNIVFGGDSAGGNLSFALLQLLLHIRRQQGDNATIRFHGKDVAVPLPAGVTGASPWLDIGRGMPSNRREATYDYLPPANDSFIYSLKQDDFWPSEPARGDIFCDLSVSDHPLASPVGAEDWRGAPPLFINAGEECLLDENKSLVGHIATQGGRIQYEYYDGMPHVFAMLLPFLPTSQRSMKSWAEFSRRCVEEPEGLQTMGTFVHAKTGKEESIDLNSMDRLSLEVARETMANTKRERVLLFEREQGKIPQESKAAL